MTCSVCRTEISSVEGLGSLRDTLCWRCQQAYDDALAAEHDAQDTADMERAAQAAAEADFEAWLDAEAERDAARDDVDSYRGPDGVLGNDCPF